MSEAAEAVQGDVPATPEVEQTGAPGAEAKVSTDPQAEAKGDSAEAGVAEAQEPGEAADVDPASYELTVPEGFEINEDLRGTLNEFAGKHRLSQDAMQEAVNLHSQMVLQMQQQMLGQADSAQAENIQKIKSMKELIGGEGLEANVGRAVAGIDNLQGAVNGIFGDDAIELRKHFHEAGIGNDPAIMQMMYAYSQTMKLAEDSTLAGLGAGAQAKPRDRVDVLYSNS